MVLLVQLLYWLLLIIWSGVVTYVILFVFFPEKLHHVEQVIDETLSPKFARHHFQKLPGSEALTVHDIVTALSHQKGPEVTKADVSTAASLELPKEDTDEKQKEASH